MDHNSIVNKSEPKRPGVSLPCFDSLTPSQQIVMDDCIKIIPYFKIVVIKGDSGSGKYTVADKIFEQLDAIVENFDFCELARRTSNEVSSQHIVQYLESLLVKLNKRMNVGVNLKRSRKAFESDDIQDELSSLTLNSVRK